MGKLQNGRRVIISNDHELFAGLEGIIAGFDLLNENLVYIVRFLEIPNIKEYRYNCALIPGTMIIPE